MGFFNFFSKKEKKETLDTGLQNTKASVFSKLTHAVAGKSKVDEDVLDNLEDVLITSDVGVDTTLDIIHNIEARVARDKYVGTSELNRILKEEIINLLATEGSTDTEGFEIPSLNRRIPCCCSRTALHLGRTHRSARGQTENGSRPCLCGLRHLGSRHRRAR